MTAAQVPTERVKPAALAVRFNDELFAAQTAKFGATTDVERGALLTVDRNTIRRWRQGRTVPLLPEAMRVAKTIDLTAADLWQGLS